MFYDQPHHALLKEAIIIDFVNSTLGPGARVAVELTLQSAEEVIGALARAIEGAEIEEGARSRRVSGRTRAWGTPPSPERSL